MWANLGNLAKNPHPVLVSFDVLAMNQVELVLILVYFKKVLQNLSSL